MEDRDQTIGVRLTLKERQALDEQATKAGLSLTEYVRTRLFSDDTSTSLDSLHLLLHHLICIVDRVHSATYSIAEAEGKLKRFLSIQELEEIDKRVREDTIRFAVDLPLHIATFQSEVNRAREAGKK